MEQKQPVSSQQFSSLQQLLAIMRQLRDPITGCEWDSKQTFDSITACTLEETYEVLDAIEQKNFPELKNELGDLLFQIIFYAQLADEQHLFNFDDICQTICDKLIRRHPHIFAETALPANSAEINSSQIHSAKKPNWEQLKQQERQAKQQFSILDDIPRAFPALMRAEKIQKRCAAVGFDWDTLAPVFDKVREELDEVSQALALVTNINSKVDSQPTAANSTTHMQDVQEEIGDLLFAIVNLNRHLHLKSEQTLHKANQKFERRFRAIEQHFQAQQRVLSQVPLDEMERVWQQIKQQEMNNKAK